MRHLVDVESLTNLNRRLEMKRTLSLLVVALSAMFLAGCWETADGEKIGTITRLNRQGVLNGCKSWEGEIIRGGLNTGSGVMGQAFHFTVENDALAKEVERMMNTQQEVKITYKQELVTFCRSDSNDVFLVKIEPLNVVSTPPAQVKVEPPQPAGTTSANNEQILLAIKRQQDQLDQNQKLMQRLLEEQNKK